ncbi:MAG: aldehyde ferredoxin oxidoreductase family protein [Desulfomonilaceae bacterium]|nr:aldehyde ferredoxin oxidoreductase family protein [Desulfomonilaceae bacterium]
MPFGYMGRILRVDLSEGKITEEEIRYDWAEKFLGGAGLATRHLYEEVPGGADPLGPENKLIFMSGPLTGTASAAAGRYSVVAKSPLTGLWGHANSGGTFGPALKRSGFDGVIFEGVSPKPVYLKLVDGHAELCEADVLWGRTVSETEGIIRENAERRLAVACIGPGGENLVRFAAIINDTHRAAGRCGLGAVMGSKRLKAVACGGKASVNLASQEEFKKSAKRQIDLIDESILKVGFESFGTNMVSDMVNVRGGYPTRNWQSGVFDRIDEVNGQALTEKVLVRGVACFACPIACGRGSEIREGKFKGHKGEGPEYETTNTLGAQCGVSDINAVTMANYLCNEYGLDTISAGSTIAFAMECFERGILTPEQTGGLQLNFGDADTVVDMVTKIALREGLGDLLALGTRGMAQRLGQGSEDFAMNVKGLELPGYDPRAAKICGLGYVTANRGGDHITGFIEAPAFIDTPILLVPDSQIEDPFMPKIQEAKILVDLENALTVFDCIGACKFMGLLLQVEDCLDLINHALGRNMDESGFRQAGERIYNLTRAFCVREGVDRSADTLPARLFKDPLPEGPAKGMVMDESLLEELKDAYYEYRGWDLATGKPTPEKLRELGLEDLIPDMWPD